MYNVNIVSNYFGSELFKDIIDRMIKIYNPLEIYLFGSYAWGQPDKNSDIDLFIIVENSDLNQADRMRIGLTELTDLNFSVDLLVLTKEDKVHNLMVLVNQCSSYDNEFESLKQLAVFLNPYATIYRYPEGDLLPPKKDVDKAMELAEIIYDFVKNKIQNNQ